ncbi:MAG: thioesterase family protein [Phenylobacterium sp.]|uniref:thioesterase family protein n=1 Tax=Phenylobacterium sp. TaxID=1871053 RepID=UPI001A5D3CF4|nr:thioesterase family protein [Phenylobacterium sp.]MBL8771523.1 thioesterase family protein [Phenylobacterium sp.]
MSTPADTLDMPLTAVGPGRWRTHAGPEWRNPGGGLWGGYAIGLCIRVMEAEPDARGEALSLTLTYAAALPAGELDVRTRRLRQGGSIGVWEVELLPAGSEEVGVHAIVTLARRPQTPPFAFAAMPEAPDPESLPSPVYAAASQHFGAQALERRSLDTFPPKATGDSRTLAWVRSRRGPLDKAILGMITDNSAPRAFYALGPTVMTTTLSLTVYLHGTAEEVAEVGHDFILVECEGRVGAGGASDERSSYWRRDGKLLATSEQLAWYREHRRDPPE